MDPGRAMAMQRHSDDGRTRPLHETAILRLNFDQEQQPSPALVIASNDGDRPNIFFIGPNPILRDVVLGLRKR